MTSQQSSQYNSQIRSIASAIEVMINSPDDRSDHEFDCNCTPCLRSGLRVNPIVLGYQIALPNLNVGMNWIHRHFLWNINHYDKIEENAVKQAIAKAMTLPRFPRRLIAVDDVDPSVLGYESVYTFLLKYCKQIKSSLPLLMLATDIVDIPNFYKVTLTELYLMLLGDNTTLGAGAQAIMIIDSLITHYLYGDASDAYMLPDLTSIDTKLDYERDYKPFAILEHEGKYEIDFIAENTCYQCEEDRADLGVVCLHANRMCSILSSNNDDKEISFWIYGEPPIDEDLYP